MWRWREKGSEGTRIGEQKGDGKYRVGVGIVMDEARRVSCGRAGETGEVRKSVVRGIWMH